MGSIVHVLVRGGDELLGQGETGFAAASLLVVEHGVCRIPVLESLLFLLLFEVGLVPVPEALLLFTEELVTVKLRFKFKS